MSLDGARRRFDSSPASTRKRFIQTCGSSLVARRSSLVARRSSLVARRSSLVVVVNDATSRRW
jgi:hypothetical protein